MTFKDVRIRSLLLTFGLVIIIASLVTYWPDSATQITTAEDRPVGGNRVDIRQQFEQAVVRLRQRQYGEAIDDFRSVLRISPAMPEAYLNMGFAHYELQHYQLAVESFQAAIDLRPSQVNAYWGLAVSLEGLCDIPGAIGAMRTYVHLARPNDPYVKRANSALWEWNQKKTASIENNQDNTKCK